VNKKVRKKIIGILGGIGCGKSTVAAGFGKLGCGVIDADKIAHEIVEKPKIKKELLKLFGNDIINASSKIDRRKVAEIAFKSPAKVAQLNRITHPPVLVQIEQLIEEYNRQPCIKAIVLDVPLLAEIDWTKRCDKLIFVECGREKRLQRSQKNDLLDEDKIKIREKFQISLDRKKKIADYIVNNNVNLTDVERQIAEIFSNIMENG
jgi:dephospho-CoA kinase